MKTIQILTLDGTFDSSLGITIDILKSAIEIHSSYYEGTNSAEIKVCTTAKKRIRTGFGLSLDAERVDCKGAEFPDYLIVPGLGISDPCLLDSKLRSASARRSIDYISAAHAHGSFVAASCSATFLIAEAGLFKQNAATTSWWLADTFRSRYPHINLQAEQLLLRDAKLICAGAAMAQADLTLAIVGKLFGEKTANLTSRYLLIDKREFQSQYVLSSLVTQRHPDVANAELWIRKNLHRDFSIAELAVAVNMSKRTLARRIDAAHGISPLKFVQQLRIELAVHLLETSSLSFESITYKVGYSDASSLRRLLMKRTGKTPASFRR